jgi:ribonucleoside-diphosphate reductase alpha chain
MATSILDYIFREVAISYLDRNDLAHVSPEDLLPDAVGGGESQSKIVAPPISSAASNLTAFVSPGFVRGRLRVLEGGASTPAPTETVIKEPVVEAQAATVTDRLAVGQSQKINIGLTFAASDGRQAQLAEARIKGYEGDPCTDCGNFTLVRNGTCLKCDTCGGTSGCS